jgi:hypothetical protein
LVYDEDYGWIRLKGGCFDGSIVTESHDTMHVSVGLSGKFTYADLNGDGYKDAIGSLGLNDGGSATYISMDVFLNTHGSAIHAASYDFGDRIGPDSIIVSHDTIKVYYTTRTPDEPMASAGSIRNHKLFKFAHNKLEELKK